jgi:D-amino-acid dehydrogenase
VNQVVIIGGGVIGLSTAFALQRRGCTVTVLDQRHPGYGASVVNAGWITPSLAGPVPAPGIVRESLRWMMRSDSPLYIRPRPDADLIRWLVSFWRHCNPRAYEAGMEATAALNERTMPLYDEMAAAGVSFEMHKTGLVSAYVTPAVLERDRRELESLKGFGVEVTEPLWGDAMRELEPALGGPLTGAFWITSDRHVRPDTLINGLVDYLKENGAEIRSGVTVTGIEHSHGRATSFRTTQGPVEGDTFVICAGAWSGKVARLAGVRLPIQGGKGYSLDFSPPPREIKHAIYLHESRVAVTPVEGMVRLAGTMEFSGINEVVRTQRVAAIARAAARCLRDWPEDYSQAKVGSGLRPMTPDGLPMIGLLPGFRNLAVASGHAMLGVTLAPATGDALADALTTGATPNVLRPFDPARFG